MARNEDENVRAEWMDEIPGDVREVLAAAQRDLAAEQKSRERSDKTKRRNWLKSGQSAVRDQVDRIATDARIPDWIKAYIYVEDQYTEDELVDIGRMARQAEKWPIARIPGIAPISIRTDGDVVAFKAASCWHDQHSSSLKDPELDFRSSNFLTDLDRVLIYAAEAAELYRDTLAKVEHIRAERAERYAADEQREIEIEAEIYRNNQEQHQQTNRELDFVTNLMRTDLVAWSMVRAMMAMVDERRQLQDRIDQAEQDLGWAQDELDSRISQLQNESSHLMSQLRDSESRNLSLDADLDDARSEIQQLKRG